MTANLRREPDAALATALLDQRNIAGFGNVYAIELPFLAGVSPFRPIAEVDGLETLVDVGTALIRFNATRSGRNTTGRRLHTGATWIYGRGRRPCPWCATQLASATDADTPWGRTSTWCPACQPAIGQARVDGERIERALALHPARRDMTRRG